ncbi:hypothetical protein DFH29DRAFT_942008 [Suillus ampliporus]|nr:hypothetical protein DFH29DRAFT_942008 [Suillus ampliporus]
MPHFLLYQLLISFYRSSSANMGYNWTYSTITAPGILSPLICFLCLLSANHTRPEHQVRIIRRPILFTLFSRTESFPLHPKVLPVHLRNLFDTSGHHYTVDRGP